MRSKNSIYMTMTAALAALYALGVVFLAPISFQLFQVRVADALLPLAILFGWPAIIGLSLGAFVANFFGPLGPVDIIGGAVRQFHRYLPSLEGGREPRKIQGNTRCRHRNRGGYASRRKLPKLPVWHAHSSRVVRDPTGERGGDRDSRLRITVRAFNTKNDCHAPILRISTRKKHTQGIMATSIFPIP